MSPSIAYLPFESVTACPTEQSAPRRRRRRVRVDFRDRALDTRFVGVVRCVRVEVVPDQIADRGGHAQRDDVDREDLFKVLALTVGRADANADILADVVSLPGAKLVANNA